jgi:predicted PurR-regulated permease PerM
MQASQLRTNFTTIIKTLLLLFLIFWGLYFSKAFLMPIAMGGVIATLFLPFCKWMEVKKLPKSIAALISIFIIMVFISGIGSLFGWQISEFANDFTLIKQIAIEKSVYFQQYILTHLGIAMEKQSQILKTEQPSLSSVTQIALELLKYVFANLILVLAYVFLILYYRHHIKQFIIKLTPADQHKGMEKVIFSTTRVAQQYLLGLAKIIVCLWVMYGIGFGILGVNNFIFFAILCGLLEIIPFIGNIAGTTLTVLVAAMHGAGVPLLVGIIAIYGVVQFIQGWVLEPLILGPQVKINPMFTIIALVLGQLVWGIPGIILAIPITAMLKIVFDHIETLKPYGFLIGEIETQKVKRNFTKIIKSWFKR